MLGARGRALRRPRRGLRRRSRRRRAQRDRAGAAAAPRGRLRALGALRLPAHHHRADRPDRGRPRRPPDAGRAVRPVGPAARRRPPRRVPRACSRARGRPRVARRPARGPADPARPGRRAGRPRGRAACPLSLPARPMRILALVLLLAVLAPAVALADGDPASDVLLQQDVFVPYSTPTSQGAANAVIEATRRAKQAGWAVKVAIIASGQDLGAASSYANDPQGYANFLYQEIAAAKAKQRLLVVSPVGFGGQNLGANVDKALSGLQTGDKDGDALAKLAATAVARLATADGHPVTAPAIDTSGANGRPFRSDVTLHSGSAATRPTGAKKAGGAGGGGGGGGGTALAIIGPLVLVAAAIGAFALRQKRRPAA